MTGYRYLRPGDFKLHSMCAHSFPVDNPARATTWPSACTFNLAGFAVEASELGNSVISKSSDLAIGADVNSYPALPEPLKGMSWNEWLARNRADEVRGTEHRIAVVNRTSVALLLVVAALWAFVGPYARALMFIIALGALAAMLDALHARRYVLASLFGATVLLYNPVFPILSLSGASQRLVIVSSVAPFLVSLVWRKPTPFDPSPVRDRREEEKA